MKYCENIYQTQRRKTREVKVGSIGIGGSNSIRIQSMTTSDTRDVNGTVEQIIKLADVGCEIARVTVQGKKEAEACEGIKDELLKKGYTIPIVADIHFYPPAALFVADFVDKVRINPGNFVDKRAMFKIQVYDEASYAEELERLEEKFTPLVEKCKRLKKAIRIGTNHGSLSDRIMNRFGDTPRGMVESALEFTHVCRKHDFHDLIFSMKASNTVVMIEAYRLLVAEMIKLGWDYPLHLGVTEAGEGEDGRVKSAIGIGALLLDGLGDTIRVSLTEDPWYEIDPCKRLVYFAKNYKNKGILPFEKHLKDTSPSIKFPLHRDGSVIVSLTEEEIASPSFFSDLGCKIELGRPVKTEGSVDAVIATTHHPKLTKLQEAGIGVLQNPYWVSENESSWPAILQDNPDIIFFTPSDHYVHNARKFFSWVKNHELATPVILSFGYTCAESDLTIHAAAEFGSLFCDQLGVGIHLNAPIPLASRCSLSFSILQGARKRSSKTEFISCPGCGRTLFDLQQVAAKIRSRTGHLPGVKIAIMGCIVNGPGEMADADFGYVGSLPGKIDLYVGKERVEKNIPMEEADERLIALIKQHGRWIDPKEQHLSPEPLPREMSERIYQNSCKVIPGGVNSPVRAFPGLKQTPIVAESGSGEKVIDADGYAYIDYCGSWGALIHGHANPRIVEAATKRLAAGSSFGMTTAIEAQFAKLIVENVPSIEKIRFVSSGTEATMSAIRLARGFTGRNLILKFSGHYHGHADSFLVQAGSGLTCLTPTSSSAGVPVESVIHTHSLPYNDIKACYEVFQTMGSKIAAVILEPVAANMGLVLPSASFLEMLREETQKIGALLIFDEVITGFRVALGGAAEYYGIDPDLCCFGKIIGGGFPAAAFGGKSEIMDKLAPLGPVYQAGTLSGNPVAMAAGMESVALCMEKSFYQTLEEKRAFLTDPIQQFIEEKKLNVCLNMLGSMFTLFFGKRHIRNFEDAKGCDVERFNQFFKILFQKGIYLAPSQFEANFISAAHTAESLRYTSACILEALDYLTNEH